ncbi:MAG: hypothetical protein KJP21_09755 [Bacteroidia bacterium]|nr:hypothetical protein [Bacteroidia bacterium]NNJ56682.1 hypothetical protein [Bacteroidia bacterium]
MRNILLLFILSFGVLANAQVLETNSGKSLSDRFFLGLASSFYVDFATTPLSSTQEYVGKVVIDSVTTADVYEDVPYQTTYISYFSMGLEPRLNIKEFGDNMAFAISAPVTLGFGQAFPSNEDVNGSYGFGSIQVPLLAKFYVGTGSTYESNEDFGLNIGGGIEMNKIGLINPGSSQEERDASKAWFMPTVCGGVHFWRGSTPMEVNVKYGFGALQTYTHDKFGTKLSGNGRQTRANSIKLTLIYLMNY